MNKNVAPGRNTGSYIACQQKNSLLPVGRPFVGICFGLILFVIVVLSLVTIVVGIVFIVLVPVFGIKNMVNNTVRDATKNSPLFADLINSVFNAFFSFVDEIGTDYIVTGIFSFLIFLFFTISACCRCQIMFFLTLFGTFIMGSLFFSLGHTLVPKILDKVKHLLHDNLFTDFDWNKCPICDPYFNGTSNPPFNKNFTNFTVPNLLLLVSKAIFNCCGIESPEDYGKLAKNNKIPVICCATFSDDGRSYQIIDEIQQNPYSSYILAQKLPDLPDSCPLEKAAKGCLKVLDEHMRDFKYFFYHYLLYVLAGLLVYFIVVICLIETFFFYYYGFYQEQPWIHGNKLNQQQQQLNQPQYNQPPPNQYPPYPPNPNLNQHNKAYS